MAAPTEVDRKKQRETRIAIGDLIEQNCKGCSTFAENHKRFGQSQAQGLCTAECDIGKQLFLLGQTLLTGRKPTPPVELNETLTKQKKVNQPLADELIREKYLELSGSLPDHKIANQFNVSTQTLKRRKKEWGLTDKRRNPAKPVNTDTDKPKRKPGRPKSMSAVESTKDRTIKEESILQPAKTPSGDETKIAELEIMLRSKQEEVLLLKAENERLKSMYEQQIKEIQGANSNSFPVLLQDFLGFTLTTRNEDAADIARRVLQQIGADLDYRVRSGIFEVTTDVGTAPIIVPQTQKGDGSHADTVTEN